jgi:Na+-translocating ferredoxin:NAD+ oxidoreductase RnfE subunit
MNSAAWRWLRLVALCPLVAIGLGWLDALLLAGVLALTLLAVDTGLLALRRWCTRDQQTLLAALLAAVASGALDLVLQAICHTHAQTLQPYLPLPIVVAILFCRADADAAALPALRATALRASAFGVSLLLGAALHAALPAESRIAVSLIACGLLLALVARIAPADTTTAPARGPRARGTGPLR